MNLGINRKFNRTTNDSVSVNENNRTKANIFFTCKIKRLIQQMKSETIVVELGKIFTLNYPLLYQVIKNRINRLPQ